MNVWQSLYNPAAVIARLSMPPGRKVRGVMSADADEMGDEAMSAHEKRMSRMREVARARDKILRAARPAPRIRATPRGDILALMADGRTRTTTEIRASLPQWARKTISESLRLLRDEQAIQCVREGGAGPGNAATWQGVVA